MSKLENETGWWVLTAYLALGIFAILWEAGLGHAVKFWLGIEP